MDKGRIMDNIQNVNARYIDNFGASQKTSVRIANPPGGKSSFSLGWDNPEEVKPKTQKKLLTNNYDNNSQDTWGNKNQVNKNTVGRNNNQYDDYSNNQKVKNAYNPYDAPEQNFQEKSGTKVKYAPGGKSNFSFGNDTTNYDDYKKNK